MADISTTFIVALAIYGALAAVGALLLVVAVGDVLRAERRVRVARHESIPTHYLRLARSH